MTKLKVFAGILSPYLVVRLPSGMSIGNKEGRQNMAARIDSTICRKRPKKRQGAKR